MSTFRLLFLGPAQFSRDNKSVDLNSSKAVALLGYLAVTGLAQTRDHLTDLLWPDSLPDAARKNLRNTLWAIRKALGEDLFAADTDFLALSDVVWVDAPTLEVALQTLPEAGASVPELQTAVELYRGPLLTGLTLTDAPDFELWLTAERERFGQLYLKGLSALVTAHRQHEQWTDIVAVARQALAYDNLQEPMVRVLMEAFARLGQRTEALRQYDKLRATLAQELGVEPLPETEALREAILDGNLQSGEPARSVVPPPPPRPGKGSPQPPAWPFVGREAELAALSEEFEAAALDQVRVVLVSGELGIGKSRLWQEWSASLPSGSTLLATRCLDTTQSLPLAPLTGLFRQSGCLEYLSSLRASISPVWLAELARLLPEIETYWPDLPKPAVLPPEEERHRLFEALTQLLRALKGQPLVLFIDDLHWVDRTTLDWLVYLVDRTQNEALLLVGTYRSSDAPAQLVQTLAGWSRHGLVRRLSLPRLTVTEMAKLVSSLGVDGTLAEQLQAKSAGNPYFLIELSRGVPGDTPPGLVELIRARLNRLPQPAQQVLQAAAVLETNFDFDTLRRISGRDEEETLIALESLLETDLLVEREARYDFAHPLVAAIVRDDLSLARRTFLHRRTAAALEDIHAGQLEAVAGQLAGHYAQAGRPTQAAHYAELAARRALNLTAPAEAVAFYHQAVNLEPTPARRLGLGEALLVQGELETGREQLHRAAAGFEEVEDCLGASRAYLALGLSSMTSGQGEQVVRWAEKALAILAAQPDAANLARAHHLLAAGGLLAGYPLAEAEAHLVKAIRLTSENDLPELDSVGRFELGNLLAQRGDLTAALVSYEQALSLAEASGGLFQRVLAHNNLAYHSILVGDLPTAWQQLESGLDLVEKHALLVPRQYLYSTSGEIALAEGNLAEAQTWFERALAEAQRNGNQPQAANIRANMGLVARERGDLDEALLLLEEARAAITGLTAPHLQSQIDLWLAELHQLRGEQVAAKEALSEAEARLADGERQGLLAWANRVRASMAG